jgi:Na+/proline symporter
VGSVNYPIIIVVGILTLIYTAYGGLAVSILTDQIQGILTIALVCVLSIYVGVTFKGDLPADLGVARDAALPPAMRWYTYESLGPNVYGYSAILVMPVSLMSATIFSEAMWQRVWASADRRTLLVGASLGCLGVIIVTFFFCFCGFLAVWAGYAVYGVTNPNLYLFQVFRDEGQTGQYGASVTVSSWIGVITLILAITMNESAIDSLQNGLAASISAHFFKGMSVWYARLAVALVNIPLIIIGTQARGGGGGLGARPRAWRRPRSAARVGSAPLRLTSPLSLRPSSL